MLASHLSEATEANKASQHLVFNIIRLPAVWHSQLQQAPCQRLLIPSPTGQQELYAKICYPLGLFGEMVFRKLLWNWSHDRKLLVQIYSRKTPHHKRHICSCCKKAPAALTG